VDIAPCPFAAGSIQSRILPLEQPEARFPKVGEVIYANCIAGATCPPTIGTSFPTGITLDERRAEGEQKNSPHLCIVSFSVDVQYLTEIGPFVARSYREATDSVKHVEEMDEDEKEMNIPLPSPASLPDLPCSCDTISIYDFSDFREASF
jgi:hypothetical protein